MPGHKSGLLTLAAIALLAGCGGGMSSGMGNTGATGNTGTTTGMSCSASSCGGSMLTLTDAKGDFLSYTVNLTSLQLQTAGYGISHARGYCRAF